MVRQGVDTARQLDDVLPYRVQELVALVSKGKQISAQALELRSDLGLDLPNLLDVAVGDPSGDRVLGAGPYWLLLLVGLLLRGCCSVFWLVGLTHDPTD